MSISAGTSKRAASKALLQRFALQQLHDQIRVAVTDIADVVDRADVRVLKDGDRARFTLKAVARLLRVHETRRKHLDRDIALEACVAGAVHLAHATAPEQRHNFIWAETGTRRQRHSA
jgi:hypothetical protein